MRPSNRTLYAAAERSRSKKLKTDDEDSHDEKWIKVEPESTNIVGDINMRDAQETEPRISETADDVNLGKEETESGISATASREDVSNKESESQMSTVDEEYIRTESGKTAKSGASNIYR